MIIFGEPDRKYHIGELQWHKVTQPAYWQVNMEDIYINDKPLNLCPAEGCKLVIDTGTSIFAAPSSGLAVLLKEIPLDDCTELESLPNLSFKIDGVFYTLKPDEYILTPRHLTTTSMLEIKNQLLKSSNELKTDLTYNFAEGTKQLCKRAFMPLDVDPPKGPLWVLGDIFLRKFFVVFNRDDQSVGIALRNKILT